MNAGDPKSKTDVEDIYPLTPMQEGMLFHALVDGTSGAYFEQVSLSLTGPLDVDAFERAFRAVIARYAVLRTSFHWEGLKRPMQMVHRSVPFSLERKRLTADATSDEALAEIRRDDRRRGFTLTEAPLMRATIVDLGERHELVWSFHHLLLDGWSSGIVTRALLDSYALARRGSPSPPSRAPKYRDYIAWLAKQDLGAAERSFRALLDGFQAPTTLAMSTGAPGDVAHHRVELDATLGDSLGQLARMHQVTVNVVMQAAWALLLSRYAGSDDVVFGVTVAGRPAELPGVEEMVGLFINSLPLRVRLDEHTTLSSLLRRIHSQQGELERFAYVPLAHVQSRSDLGKGQPLFESLFVFESFPIREALAAEKASGLTVGGVETFTQTNYPLNVIVVPGRRLSVSFAFDDARFDGVTIAQLGRHYHRLLADLVARPSAPLRDRSLLDEAERRAILSASSSTAHARPADRRVHELVAAWAKETPDALAVAAGERTLTYAELDRRANQLARLLQRRGIGPESVVGIAVERSPEMIIALLAVHKAGGAYIPLDLAHPADRLRWVLADSGAALVLTTERWAALAGERAICFDRDAQQIADEAITAPSSRARPDNSAYVIYTSGSTGQPKGVVATHAGLDNLVAWHRREYEITTRTRATQLASAAFDAAVWEVWPHLAAGASVHIVPDEVRSDDERLLAWYIAHQITISFTASPLAELLLEATSTPDSAPGLVLDRLLTGADRLRRRPREGQSYKLVNCYGPTENTVIATTGTVLASDVGRPPSIGKPIDNVATYILDERLALVPPGVAGELYLGGTQLARGYVGRPELTAERFVPSPYGAPGTRMYATGDRARFLPGGSIDFIGRVDHQVKIRGFRVELGEIEHAILRLDGVREATVLPREDQRGHQQLVGYLVGRPDLDRVATELRRTLPAYMVPSAWVLLEAMPHTSNGKIDRRALPAPADPRSNETYVAPRDEVETQLATIWRETLGVQRVGVRDDFFTLGGHSLLATRLMSQVRHRMKVDLPVRVLFDASTVELLAARVAEARAPAGVPLVAVARTGKEPLSFAQQRLWFLHQLAPTGSAWNMGTTLRLAGPIDDAALDRAFDELFRRHESLRTVFPMLDGQPVQRILDVPTRALTQVDLSSLSSATRTTTLAAALRESHERPFDLENGPLFTATLHRLGAADHVLSLRAHHIICDGSSVGVFVRDLAALYGAFAVGKPSPLARLPVQYVDYARWQLETMRGEVLEAQLRYWRAQLADVQPLRLPSDEEPEGPRAGQLSLALPPLLTSRLRALAHAQKATPFMAVTAAFQLLLGRLSGTHDVAIGCAMSNRSRVETEGLIGLFLNVVVLRTIVNDATSFDDLLGRVRATTLAAYAHQDLPFEKLVTELKPERTASGNPFFDVLVNAVPPDATSFALGGLRAMPMELDTVELKYPLTLYIYDDGARSRLDFVYQRRQLSDERMREMGEQLHVLLEQLAASPTAPLEECSLVTPRSRALFGDPSDPLAEPTHEPIVTTFGACAERGPTTVAVRQGERELTYAELAADVERGARAFVAMGVQPGDPVVVTGERSPALVSCSLAVLRAGGVLLLLDPKLPLARRREMCRLGGAKLAIRTDAGELDELGIETRTWSSNHDGDETLPSRAPEDPAYLFFTSGTTGTPKGVLGSHRGLAHFLAWQRDAFVVGPGDRTAQLTALSFDVVLRDLFLPLTSGATLCLPPPALDVASEEALAWMASERVTLLHVVPSVARVWLAQPAGALPPLRWVFFAGEPLTDALVTRWRDRFGRGGVANFYGPTETSLAKCCYVVPPVASTGVQPVGRPLPQTQALVWSGERSCGVGEPGEIVIRTPFRSLGYLQPRAEDAARFVVNPFSRDPRDLVYRTGDLGRLRPDGELEILGRVDHQVKIRGVRVELGEIESVLGRHPSVRSAVIVAIDGDDGDKRLVAYVVAEPRPSGKALKSHLAEVLPEAMLPSGIVFMTSMPLLPNGKIDRRALPEPSFDTGMATFVAPRTTLEQKLAQIWLRLLRRPRVSVRDSFFEVGGHSLLATQLVSEVRRELGVTLPLRTIFDAPTIEDLAAQVELARGKITEIDAVPLRAADWSAYARDGGHVFPLSFAQERLWFLEQLDPGNVAYNIPTAVALRGPLDAPALEAALEEVMRRHAILRTRFFTEHGVGWQLVEAHRALGLPIEDLSGAADRAGALAERLREEVTRPFDLVRGPPLRARLIRVGPEEHFLLFTMHHVVSDAWSMGRMVREVGALYGARRGLNSDPLPALEIQYPDYVLWQRDRLSGDELQRQARYWKQALIGAPPLLALPTDRPRPPVQSHRGGSFIAALPRGLGVAVHRLAEATGTTPFMVLLTAFQLLLMKYSGERDVVVGTPIAGRPRKELEPLIGLFVNTLAMRLQLQGDETVEALLARAREQTLTAYAHQDIPFERLVDELKPSRSLGHTPVFQVMLVLQNTPVEQEALPGLAANLVDQERTAAKVDLELSVIEDAGGFDVTYTYASDLFERETIERLARHYGRLLEAMTARPDRKVSMLALLDDAERWQLVETWNATTQPASDALVHQLFVAQANKTPGAIALRWAGQTLTYAELDARSNQLAHALRRRGLAPESRIGICLERSLDLVVALLATSKAGCAYVPLDPSYPQARLDYMLADANVALVVTQASLADRIAATAARLCVDRDTSIAAEPRTPVPERAHPDSVAYVVYTSGSTGQPKGVMGTHRATVNRIAWMLRTIPFGDGEVACQKTALSFVDSIWEIFGPLAAGVPSVIISDEQVRDPAAFVSTLAEHHVTRVVVVPSLLRALCDAHDGALAARLPDLRVWSVSGEALEADLIEQFVRCVPAARLVNLYGSSEVAGDATAACDAQSTRERASIGVPIDNTQVYVFDADGQLAPVGVPGEIYVGGLNLARGYFGMPALTAEKFVPDPFGEGRRLYRTGDLARWLPDGTLEYVGRIDHQVKVHGFRIELGEIEAALSRVPGVREVVAVVREDRPADRRVVAYVVGDVDLDALPHALADTLPPYMIPGAFVALESFPLTPSGKIDRRSLPAPTFGSRRSAEPPRNPTELVLAKIYAVLVGTGEIGRDDDFFALGGNSFQAMRLVSRIRDALGVELPVRKIFEHRTVAGLAQVVTAMLADSRAPARPPLVARAPRARYPLSSFQARIWRQVELEPGSRIFNLHYLSALTDGIDVALLERAFEEVLRRHTILRTTYHTENGEPYQTVHPPPPFALALQRLDSDGEDELVRRMVARTQLAFDLSNGPLLEGDLFELPGRRRFLLVRLHHIVADRWSIDLLENELVTSYQALATKTPSRLPELPVQYVDFAEWQRQWLTPEVANAQLRYWEQLLADCPPVQLRSQRARPAAAAQGSGGVEGHLGPEATRRAQAFLRSGDLTVFMLTAVACAIVLARESGSLDQIIGVPLANRPDASLERLIGYFVNHLALRVRLAPSTTARALLGAVREQTLNLHASRDVLLADTLAEELRARLYQFRLNVAPSELPQPPTRGDGMPALPSNNPFELGVYVTEARTWTGVALRYRSELFERATAERIHRELLAIIEAVVTSPEQTIADLLALRVP